VPVRAPRLSDLPPDEPAFTSAILPRRRYLSTFYDFPAEHWLHLRTSNAIESVFAGVRLRTNVAKRARVRENALYLVFKIVERLGQHWRTF
jgi:putative transposase